MKLMLLLSPLAKGAYFADAIDVAAAELMAVCPVEGDVVEQGGLTFFRVDADKRQVRQLARLSFVQGIFEDTGDGLHIVDADPNFLLHEDLVYGAKYRGKTNELMTQLALNVALAHCHTDAMKKGKPLSLLDPMAGRGTTLLWALRYGLNAKGVEVDRAAPDDLHRHIKKQSKLHKIKHQHQSGVVGTRKDSKGTYQHYTFGDVSLRLLTGDAQKTPTLVAQQKFDLVVSDLPYGVQFKGQKERSPFSVVERCAKGWVASMREGASLVLVFNSYQPKRDDLIGLFEHHGLDAQPFEAPHRMSESIVRDVVVFQKP